MMTTGDTYEQKEYSRLIQARKIYGYNIETPFILFFFIAYRFFRQIQLFPTPFIEQLFQK